MPVWLSSPRTSISRSFGPTTSRLPGTSRRSSASRTAEFLDAPDAEAAIAINARCWKAASRLTTNSGKARTTADGGSPSGSIRRRGKSGSVSGIVSTIVDVTSQKHREQTLRTLLREVSHRSKNLLAIIQSIATQTGRYSGSIDVFLTRFRGRIQSLASSQDLVTSSNWRGATLSELVAGQVSRYCEDPRLFDPPQGRRSLSQSERRAAYRPCAARTRHQFDEPRRAFAAERLCRPLRHAGGGRGRQAHHPPELA